MAHSGIQTRHLLIRNRGYIRHMYYTSHQRLCNIRVHKSAGHGQNQEKEKKLRLLN